MVTAQAPDVCPCICTGFPQVRCKKREDDECQEDSPGNVLDFHCMSLLYKKSLGDRLIVVNNVCKEF